MKNKFSEKPEFDHYADQYKNLINQSLPKFLSETDYYTRYKVEHVFNHRQNLRTQFILDYGCGVGLSLKAFSEYFPNSKLWGYDISSVSIKNAKKQINKTTFETNLDNIPKNLPSLLRAQKIQKKAAKEGFDWDQISDVFDKLDEEIAEFKEAALKKKTADIQNEIGDIIFVITNIAKFYKIDAEEAVRSTNNKFIKRFQYIEEKIKAKGKTFKDFPIEEMERYWQDAKNK